MEDIINKYNMYISAYQAIEKLDEYPLKVYILAELKELIADYCKDNNLDFCFQKKYDDQENKTDDITKLHDALFIINELNGPIDLIHLIEKKIKQQKDWL